MDYIGKHLHFIDIVQLDYNMYGQADHPLPLGMNRLHEKKNAK